MLLLLAVLWMGAKEGKDRNYFVPCGCVSPFHMHPRDCLARNPGPGPFQLSPSCPISPPVTNGGKRRQATPPCKPEGLRLKTWRAWIPRRSPSKFACSRSQGSPGQSGTPATFAPTRARSWRTRLELRSALRFFRTRRRPTCAGWQAGSAPPSAG